MHTFCFDNAENKAHLIYAPNGVMKTSFANTFNDICKGAISKDHFFPERPPFRAVKFQSDTGQDLVASDILVIEPYLESYKSQNMSVLLADDKIKEEYEKIHREIEEKMHRVITSLNALSGKRNSEELLTTDYEINIKNLYELLVQIYLENESEYIEDFNTIKYGKLFTSDAEKVLVDKNFLANIEKYILQYEKLLSESKVFKAGFNHNSANDVLTSLKKEGFFKADHRVILAETQASIDDKEFQKVITEEKTRIVDSGLEKEFQLIDDILSSKKGNKDLRDFIFENKHIIPELRDIKTFKKKIWISYLFKDKMLLQEAVLNYQNNKKRLDEIISIAKTQTSKWNEIVNQFNERFSNMPFRLKVDNKDDVVLKSSLPSISFIYKDKNNVAEVEEKDLVQRLSNGEKKALYLLNIMFELKARDELNSPTLLIMDDIADSFDYRNKYAIIEYIKDIVDNELFMPIILTHNFDFYRTVAGRVEIKKTSNFVLKMESEIKLIHGQYFENVFDKWREKVYQNPSVFISSIAFVRNLVEYIKGKKDFVYLNLTSLLHYKKFSNGEILSTMELKNSHLFDWFHAEWGRDKDKFQYESNQNVYNLIIDTASGIVTSPREAIEIEDKIVLSIAIRLLAEKYMVERVSNDEEVKKINGNQTRQLKDMIVFDESNKDDLFVKQLIEKVLVITSENIHINSFMYEPIVDMSLIELINLFKEVQTYLQVST